MEKITTLTHSRLSQARSTCILQRLHTCWIPDAEGTLTHPSNEGDFVNPIVQNDDDDYKTKYRETEEYDEAEDSCKNPKEEKLKETEKSKNPRGKNQTCQIKWALSAKS